MSTGDFSTESVGERELEQSNRAYAILKNRDLRLYLTGKLIATIGQQMLATAVGWELFDRTHSVMKLALVGLTQVTPMILFTLPAGHVADNHDRKRVITFMTLIVAVSSLGLTFISWKEVAVFWMYVCLFVSASARTFLTAASASFLPSLVGNSKVGTFRVWSIQTF